MYLIMKVWSWLKRNWQWVVFPVGLFILLGKLTSVFNGISNTNFKPIDFKKEEKELEEELVAAEEEKKQKLDELKIKHWERLGELKADQKKELEELQEKPLEEVVKWFDSL